MASGGISSIIPYAVNFSLVLGLVVYYGRKPLKKFIYQRHERQKDIFDIAKKKKEESEERIDRVKQLLANLGQEKENILAESQRLSDIEIKELMDKTGKEKIRLSKDIERAIGNEKTQAMKFLQNEFVRQISDLAEKNIREQVKEKNHESIISAAIKNTENHKKLAATPEAGMEVET